VTELDRDVIPEPGSDSDVVIVGGRVAAAATAILLAERGHRVSVVDRDSETSEALSTHVFGDWEAFDRLGLTAELADAGAPAITRFRTEFDGAAVEGELAVTPYVLCLRRRQLDAILAARARSLPTVEWFPCTTATELIFDGDRVGGVRVRQGARRAELRASVVVGADGRNSLVARGVGAEVVLERPASRCAYYGYFADAWRQPIATFEYHYCGEDLVLVAPCDDELHCVCVMPPQDDFNRWRRAPQELLHERLGDAGTLTPRFATAQRVSGVRGSGTLKSYLRTSSGPGWALVGDAGAMVHPCIGAGIDHAARSAGELSDALDSFLQGRAGWDEALASYDLARDQIVLPTLELAAALAAKSGPPPDERALFGLLVSMPGLGWELAANSKEIVSTVCGTERLARLSALAGVTNGTPSVAEPEPTS